MLREATPLQAHLEWSKQDKRNALSWLIEQEAVASADFEAFSVNAASTHTAQLPAHIARKVCLPGSSSL